MAKRSKFWTTKEESLLKENANIKTLEELQLLFPGRSKDSISRKLERLGLGYRSSDYLWTQEEENLLRKMAPQNRLEELVLLFPNRSENAIKVKIKNMGLTYLKNRHVWTEEEIKYLKTNWLKMTNKDIARNLHLGLHTVSAEAKKLGLESEKKKTNKKWTKENLRKLQKLSREMSIKELAAYFKTTYSAIRSIANKNGIHLIKKDRFWTNALDLQLRNLANAGYNISEIAKIMHKTDTSILRYAERENIIISKSIRKTWNSEKDRELITLVNQGYDLFQIVEIMDFSDLTILKNAKRLNLQILGIDKKPWTKEEEELLKELAKSKTLNELVVLMRRTSKSIKWKAETLEIPILIDKNVWTNEDLELLKEMVASRKTLVEIMTMLGRSSRAIKQKMKSEGIASYFEGRPWTKEDEELLKELWGTYPPSKIASILGREISAICERSTKLGLGSQISNNYDGLGIKDLCEIFKVSPTVISITWVALGLKLKVRNTSNVSCYKYVILEDLLEFLYLNQNIWDSRPLEWYALGSEPDWLKEKRRKDGLLPRNYYGAINVERELTLRRSNTREVTFSKRG